MKPITPVIPGYELPVTVFAKDQPQYLQLPAFVTPDSMVVTRWKLTWRERLRVLFHGNLWLKVLTFHGPLQPIKIQTTPPNYLAHEYECGKAAPNEQQR